MSGFEGCPSLVKAYRSDVLAGSQKNAILAVPEQWTFMVDFAMRLNIQIYRSPTLVKKGAVSEEGPTVVKKGARLQVVKGWGVKPCQGGGRLQVIRGSWVKPLSRGPAPSREGLGGQTLVGGCHARLVPLRGWCPMGRHAWCQSPSFT